MPKAVARKKETGSEGNEDEIIPDAIKEALICQVKQHPAIWDTKIKEHRRHDIVSNDWTAVHVSMEEMFPDNLPTKEQLKATWKTMRGTYRRILLKIKDKPSGMAAKDVEKVKWPFFQQMLFLEGGKANINTQSSIAHCITASATENLEEQHYNVLVDQEGTILGQHAVVNREDVFLVRENASIGGGQDRGDGDGDRDGPSNEGDGDAAHDGGEMKASTSRAATPSTSWEPLMQRQSSKKRKRTDDRGSHCSDVYAATMAMLKEKEEEEEDDAMAYCKFIATQIRRIPNASDRLTVCNRIGRLLEDSIKEFV